MLTYISRYQHAKTSHSRVYALSWKLFQQQNRWHHKKQNVYVGVTVDMTICWTETNSLNTKTCKSILVINSVSLHENNWKSCTQTLNCTITTQSFPLKKSTLNCAITYKTFKHLHSQSVNCRISLQTCNIIDILQKTTIWMKLG